MSRKQYEDSRGAIGERSPRGPLGWFPRLGMDLLAFAADASTGAGASTAASRCPPGYTGGGSVGNQYCCGLAQPNNECCYPTHGRKSQYICPAGFHKTHWFCTQGTITYGCGECSRGTTCFAGPWQCSILWQVP